MNATFVNLHDYPIDRPDTDAYQAMVADQQKRLCAEGMINLVDFLTPAGVLKYRHEIKSHLDIAYHAISERHPYGYERSDQFPEDHPRNTFGSTESFRLARHHLPGTAIDELYCWPPMKRFIADITGNDEIYLSGDPSNGLVVQFYKEGCGQAWHFDQALFSTIINLSESEAGGAFECVPNLRTETEPNYDEVRQVLAGESAKIQKHQVKAGSFTVMLGRYTLHRVTPVEQVKPRISVILSYELQPNIYMDLATRKISFGPTAPDLP
ncbi:MAG: hypothetical protein GY875_03195 [Gammaproteobacteria bacterium]|nr:hypothetical protein [Gammaproteobacteria bacterium]